MLSDIIGKSNVGYISSSKRRLLFLFGHIHYNHKGVKNGTSFHDS